MVDTNAQFDRALKLCRDLFVKKLHDYGAAWRIMRATSITDQIFIKANRIRSLEIKKESKVGEGILPEFIGIVNYGIIGLIQLLKGHSETEDMGPEDAIKLYDCLVEETKTLPKTNAINSAEYKDFYDSMLKDYDEVMLFCLSSEMSSSFNNAHIPI